MKNWNHIPIILTVASSGTVSAAAKELGVSHSTLLRHINDAEGDLGFRVFERLQSGYRLTGKGASFCNEVRPMAASMERMSQKYNGADRLLEGSIRVVQPDVYLNIYNHYSEFKRLYPKISLEITSSFSPPSMTDFNMDVAIAFTDKPCELAIAKQLKYLVASAYASQEYLSRLGSQATLADFDWLLLRPEHEPLEKSRIYQWLRSAVESPKIALQAVSMNDILAATQAGMGVGFLDEDSLPSDSRLIKLPNTRITSTRKFWVMCHRESWHLAKVQCFMRFIHERLEYQVGC